MPIRSLSALLGLLVIAALIVWDQSYTEPLSQYVESRDLAHALCAQKMSDTPVREFRSDGCTLWPNALNANTDYGDCCIRHDMDYWCGGTAQERSTSDNAFKECVSKKQPILGTVMYWSSRIFGYPMLPDPWRWGSGHADWPRGYDAPQPASTTSPKK